MWMAAFFGMATKYAEGFAIKYWVPKTLMALSLRPMYYIVNGMGQQWKPLAIAFSIFVSLLLSLAQELSQVNSITDSQNTVGWSPQGQYYLGYLVSIIILGESNPSQKSLKVLCLLWLSSTSSLL